MNLIRIELRKMKMGWYVRGALIANLIIMGFLWLICYSEKADSGFRSKAWRKRFSSSALLSERYLSFLVQC